jgi:hypothetical protein
VFKVLFWGKWILVRRRKWRPPHPTWGRAVDIQAMDPSRLPLRDLFLEQGVQHDRGRAAILQPADTVTMRAQGRRTSHERVAEPQAHV